MTLMLAADDVQLFAAGPPDATGWVEPGTGRAYWAGLGNLQLTQGFADQAATSRGGHGPNDPAAGQRGTLYLPPDVADVADGHTAQVRGQSWVLSQVRRVADPMGGAGGLDCLAATVTETGTWAGG